MDTVADLCTIIGYILERTFSSFDLHVITEKKTLFYATLKSVAGIASGGCYAKLRCFYIYLEGGERRDFPPLRLISPP